MVTLAEWSANWQWENLADIRCSLRMTLMYVGAMLVMLVPLVVPRDSSPMVNRQPPIFMPTSAANYIQLLSCRIYLSLWCLAGHEYRSPQFIVTSSSLNLRNPCMEA